MGTSSASSGSRGSSKEPIREQSGRSALVRIACRELEAWVAGDLFAVAAAFQLPKVASAASKKKFREPDKLTRPIESLRELVKDYQKVEGARRVGPLLEANRNASPSFKKFCDGVRRLLAAEGGP